MRSTWSTNLAKRQLSPDLVLAAILVYGNIKLCATGTLFLILNHVALPFVVWGSFRFFMRRSPDTKFFFYLCLISAVYMFYVYQKEIVGVFRLQKV